MVMPKPLSNGMMLTTLKPNAISDSQSFASDTSGRERWLETLRSQVQILPRKKVLAWKNMAD